MPTSLDEPRPQLDHATRALLDLAQEAVNETVRAQAKHAPMHSMHEGYAILLEELDELWDEIKRDRPEAARKEAVQVAATALRFLYDLEGELTPD